MTLRSNQFPVRAIRWWTLLPIWRLRRWVCCSLSSRRSAPEWCENSKEEGTDGDLPLGADTEVLELVVPSGSGGEVGIAIVAPPPSLAHDEGVVTLGPHGHRVSAEFLPFEAGASIALNTVEVMSPTTRRKTEHLVFRGTTSRYL